VIERPPCLTVRQAARFLQVDEASVYRWIQAGKLRAYRLGGTSIRIAQEQLNEFLEGAETWPVHEAPETGGSSSGPAEATFGTFTGTSEAGATGEASELKTKRALARLSPISRPRPRLVASTPSPGSSKPT
jgi:excisionase family DNA binding protein